MPARTGRPPRAERISGVLAERLSDCDLRQFVRVGLRALGNHASMLSAGKALATDSMGFDDAVRNAPTFDYLVGLKGSKQIVAALEVHPAQTADVRQIVAKKGRTEDFLLDRGCVRCMVDRWIWIPTSGVSIRTPTQARLLLAQNGIGWPVSRQDLAKLVETTR